jgi:serine/threonine-protein kinase
MDPRAAPPDTTAPGPDPDFRPADLPTHAGRCELGAEIGRGGMGAVLLGRDPELDRPLAVKVLLPGRAGDADLERRFLAEAQICGRLQHPGVVPVHDVGRLEDGRPFFTMKLVKGRTLADLLAERRTPADELPRFVQIFEQVCQAVAYAHSRGVIHRDLKPSNVMVGEFGEVQVMDWGLAKVLTGGPAAPASPPVSTIRTVRTADPGGGSRAGTVVGTPAYMAPEQALGLVERVDARADVFGLGAVLCEVLTGKPPYRGRGGIDMIQAASADLEDAFARLDGCGADVELVRLAKTCLDPKPERRPADAGAVAEAVAAHRRSVEERLRRAELARVAAQEKALRERQRRWWTLALAASGLLTLAAAGVAGWLWQLRATEAVVQAAAAKAEADARAAAAVTDLDAAAAAAAAGEDATATAALERAEGRLAGGGPEALRERLRQLRDDLAFAAELEEARLKALETTKESAGLDWAGADAALAEAFAGRGLDVTGPGSDAARERIGRSAVKARVVTALDAWAGVKRNAKLEGWKELLAAAGRADDTGDEARRRLREAAAREDKDRLLTLAGDRGVADWPAADAVLLAEVLRAAKEPEAAEQVLRAARARNAGDFWVNALLGGTLGRSAASREEGIGFWRAAVTARPHAAAAHNNLGILLAGQGQAAEAEREYREAIRLRPDQPDAHNNLGALLREQGKAAEAEKEYRDALRLNPDDPVAHNNLGNLLADQGKPAEAEKEYREALRLQPDYPLAHNGLGALLAGRGQPVEAEAEFREALRIKPDYADAHSNLGASLADQGHPAEAEKEYREALRIKADFPEAHKAHANLGNLLNKRGKPEEAEKEYREAIRLRPDFPEAHHILGLLLAGQGRAAAAEREYREAIRLRPAYPEAHTNLGTLLAGRGQPAEAEAEFREALRIKPAYAEAHYNLGLLLDGQNRPAEAEAEYREAIRLKPDLFEAHNNLGNLLADQGKAAGAEKEYREALRLKPDLPDAHFNLGHVLRDQGRFREALVELSRGHELGSRDSTWKYPSAAWVEDCRRLVVYDALLPAVIDGSAEPADAESALGFARVCQITRRHAAAARLLATVMDAAPGAVNDPRTGLRYNAACSAARAACGQGDDAPRAGTDRARLRTQALEWLRADLAAWTNAAGGGDPKLVAAAGKMLQHWREDPDLAGVRDADALAKLPEDERAEWKKLWADVDALLQKVSPKQVPPAANSRPCHSS